MKKLKEDLVKIEGTDIEPQNTLEHGLDVQLVIITELQLDFMIMLTGTVFQILILMLT